MIMAKCPPPVSIFTLLLKWSTNLTCFSALRFPTVNDLMRISTEDQKVQFNLVPKAVFWTLNNPTIETENHPLLFADVPWHRISKSGLRYCKSCRAIRNSASFGAYVQTLENYTAKFEFVTSQHNLVYKVDTSGGIVPQVPGSNVLSFTSKFDGVHWIEIFMKRDCYGFGFSSNQLASFDWIIYGKKHSRDSYTHVATIPNVKRINVKSLEQPFEIWRLEQTETTTKCHLFDFDFDKKEPPPIVSESDSDEEFDYQDYQVDALANVFDGDRCKFLINMHPYDDGEPF
jgi:hypothetical protein